MASDAEVDEAARRAQVTGFASALPLRLDSPVGEGTRVAPAAPQQPA